MLPSQPVKIGTIKGTKVTDGLLDISSLFSLPSVRFSQLLETEKEQTNVQGTSV